jgi:hypothetical protein
MLESSWYRGERDTSVLHNLWNWIEAVEGTQGSVFECGHGDVGHSRGVKPAIGTAFKYLANRVLDLDGIYRNCRCRMPVSLAYCDPKSRRISKGGPRSELELTWVNGHAGKIRCRDWIAPNRDWVISVSRISPSWIHLRLRSGTLNKLAVPMRSPPYIGP